MKIANISFGSIYCINYDYKEVRVPGATIYRSKNEKVNDFVEYYNKKGKDKDDISAINPEKRLYFIKVNDKKDNLFEYQTQNLYGIKIKKVTEKDMEGANITSIGKSDNEKETVSKYIGNYEILQWYRQERADSFKYGPIDD